LACCRIQIRQAKLFFCVNVFSVIGVFRNEGVRRRSGDRLRESGDGRRESIYHSDRTRNRANDVAKQEKTIECAKAIGLDSDYLTKLEEQKKMREVILRKKEERRIQTVQRLGGPISVSDQKSVRQLNRTSNFDERRIERSRRMDEEHSNRRKYDSRTRRTSGIRNGKRETVSGTSSDVSREIANSGRLETPICAEKGLVTNSSITQKIESTATANDSSVEQSTAGNTAAVTTTVTSIRRAKRENEQNPERARKKKAYLAVVVNSLNQVPINVDKIRIIAETVGPTKKVWRSSENTVSLIFEEHESAKKFMFHYHRFVHILLLELIIFAFIRCVTRCYLDLFLPDYFD
uniref:PWI domain-containing protein n=1 Tax=Onchocerca flexuosa TaxID=387005 RepID=A0A183HL88_9BILA